jgi:hypothetical protein
MGSLGSLSPPQSARGYEVKVGVKAIAQHCLKVDAEFIATANPVTVLALLDALEAAQNRSVELPSFDGYVPHIAKELQAAFKIACATTGITVRGMT